MLVHKDQDNIVFYFPVQSCSRDMGQHCTGNFLVQNAGTWRLRQHCIGSFPAKTCLYALGQHCASNCLVQCCLRRVWTTLTGQYSYAMLSQHGRYNIAQVIFFIKVVCLPCANIAQVISLCNFDAERFDVTANKYSSKKITPGLLFYQ